MPSPTSYFIIILFDVIELLFFVGNVRSGALQSVGVTKSLYDIPGLGNRPVKIRFYPGIDDVQSDLYEVYGEPYNYDVPNSLAIAVLVPEEESDVKGDIMFIQQHPPVSPTFITGNITGLKAGKHGIHVHLSGDLRKGCEKLGGHFNPFMSRHGGPRSPLRHLGDLGNIEAGEDGIANVNIIDPLMSLSSGPRGVIGRALVVTADPDDLGRGETAESVTDGSSGKPVACGVIAYIR